MPVKRLPIVLASRLIGDPGFEIRMGRVRVIVLVVLAVIPVVLLVLLASRHLPPVVDMDVVVLLAVGPLLSMSRVLWVWFFCFESVHREVASASPFLAAPQRYLRRYTRPATLIGEHPYNPRAPLDLLE